jgi:hypothetical protein
MLAMKSQLLLLFLFLVTSSFVKTSAYAQDGAVFSEAELQKFWDSNIKAIVDLDADKIIQQTNFPLQGDWYVAYELWEASDEELEQAYKNDPGVVFDPDVRSMLASMTWENVTVNDYEEGIVLTVPVYLTYEEEGEIYEFATIFEFATIDEQWMLIAIVYAG